MARWNKSDKARIEQRRLNVEQLSARGLGLWEIVNSLEELGIVNTKNGKPYSIATVSRDLEEIETRWREMAVEERDIHKAQQLKELRSARRSAWKDRDYSEVRRNLETEMKLLGTESPNRLELAGVKDAPLVVVSWDENTNDAD